MHEAAIAEGILRVVLGALPKRPVRVLKINVVAGALQGVVDESLRAWFEQISQSTPARGAEIHVNHLPAHVVCQVCGHAFDFDGSGPVELDCPKCSGPIRLEGGREMYVDNVEIDDEDQGA